MSTDLLARYPVVIPVTVAWGEMDAFQHVNNIVYFRYFESARMAYFARIDFADPDRHGGIGPILAHTQCRYRKALTYPDTLAVGARVSELREDRFFMELCVVSEKLGRLAAEGTAELVAFDYRHGRKALLPQAVRHNIAKLEGGEVRQ
ncbi:MAG: acyl-CoA thioesterase [candidate division KSB1 bacterium]|nr:acyl-CoA thioesterase [candidate division KSB1 bacterium]MDZ7273947.1 acyl-CoA thioesterase [candidate division KSB1 bacterium]MDZ7286103.1 acyl-CoA thioesterase [candidate division KSB1 bacterium]MDZ7299135.1 acyl-CoA thioesterase [candidate division KSB1 bacterium]MDZ7308332.1 acyl-CoA thioesterase [candidate division KSB1 bacterium]